MRRLTITLLVLALCWTGFWGLGSFVVQRLLFQATDQLESKGWAVDQSAPETLGFPSAFQTRFRSFDLINAAEATSLEMTGLEIKAASYWPGYSSASIEELTATFGPRAAQITLKSRGARAMTNLRAGLDLELARLEFVTAATEMQTTAGSLAEFHSLGFDIFQSNPGEGRYTFDATLHGLTPGRVIRSEFRIDQELPQTFGEFYLLGQLEFDTPLTRHDLKKSASLIPKRIQLHTLNIVWGKLAVTGHADISFASKGLPEGAAELKVAHWRTALKLIQPMFSLSQSQIQQVEFFLSALANRDGTSTDLTIPVTFHDGKVSVSGISLGSMPPLFQRQ